MTDPVDKKTLGKLLEELGECTSATARCLIQGIDEAEPITGKINRQWLQEEIADVYANLALTVERFNLDIDKKRIDSKMTRLKNWHTLA